MSKHPSSQYTAKPLEDNIFEWHFTIRGTTGTEFEGGIYHGRIILPTEYPFKPPNIVLLTPNGRFEVGVKICLSISAHHPEFWQPSWSIRTVLLALISFMPSKGEGALGALDWTPKERKALALRSPSWTCKQCGSCNATALLEPSDDPLVHAPGGVGEDLSSIVFKPEGASTKGSPSPSTSPSKGEDGEGHNGQSIGSEAQRPPPRHSLAHSRLPPPPIPTGSPPMLRRDESAPSTQGLDKLIFVLVAVLSALLLKRYLS